MRRGGRVRRGSRVRNTCSKFGVKQYWSVLVLGWVSQCLHDVNPDLNGPSCLVRYRFLDIRDLDYPQQRDDREENK